MTKLDRQVEEVFRLAGLPKPPVPDGPVRELFDALHRLHHRSGWPSLREMAKAVGCSHTTISAAFSEPRVPRWGLLELIVETLGGDTEAFHRLWLAAGADSDPVSVPRTLPADVAGFVGRDAEVAQLDRLLEALAGAAVAVLSGSAGIGKTALAVHWAHRVAARFPDGQLYVNVRGYDPDNPLPPGEALGMLLRQLGVADAAIPGGDADRAARFRTLIAGKRALLIIDNAHSVAQVRDLLPGTPGCLTLITSRDALPALIARHGATRITIGLLDEPAALGLLRLLVGERVDASPAGARALAQQCARLPLALRIAAELAAARPRVSLDDLAAEIRQRRLDSLDADDEYTAVRAVFSWSLRHLREAHRHAFACLGAHPGQDIDLRAAAALFDVDGEEARRTMDGLVRAHLIEELDAGRYGMHDLLRAYAAELAGDGCDDARLRLFDHYLDAAREATAAAYAEGADQARARRWLDTERANLLAVAAAAVDTSPRHTRGLAETLTRYLDTGAHYRDAVALEGLCLRAAGRLADPAGEGTALTRLGVAHRRLGEYEQALECHERALRIQRALADPGGQARSLLGIGSIEWRLGRYREALGHISEAFDRYRQMDDEAGMAAALHNLGIIHRRLGHYDEALTHYERALAAQCRLGNVAGQAGARNNLGIVQLRLGLYAEALGTFEEALEGYRGLGDRAGEGAVLNNMGETYERLGQYAYAVRHHEQALAIHSETGYRAGHAVALHGLGVAFGHSGRHTDALAKLEQALALATEIGEADIKTRVQIDMAGILHATGDTAGARQRWQAGLALAEAAGNLYEQARAHDGLSLVDNTAAADHADRARALFTKMGVAEAARFTGG